MVPTLGKIMLIEKYPLVDLLGCPALTHATVFCYHTAKVSYKAFLNYVDVETEHAASPELLLLHCNVPSMATSQPKVRNSVQNSFFS